jgi:L-amino acid N-acyltransferase YncA
VLSPEDLWHHAPDAHWVVIDDRQGVVARCSLWWSNTPSFEVHSLGVIGHYAASDAEAGALILQHAAQQLAARRCHLAVGPMDGNTWRRYRFVTDRGTEPVFFLEPDNPDDWPAHFLAEGFEVLASYTSALNPDLAQQDPRMPEVKARVAYAGVTIRAARPQVEAELPAIYAISRVSFQNNFLYTPIDEQEFLTQYHKILHYVRSELVLLAEHNGKPVGFSFAIPDLLEAQRRPTIETIIVKTVAVLPSLVPGLGSLLVALTQEHARQLGYRRAIHALMHETNKSRKISNRYGHTIRQYSLFSKRLTP